MAHSSKQTAAHMHASCGSLALALALAFCNLELWHVACLARAIALSL